MTHRPLLHFAPRRNWMNDPNGLVFHDGRYHLFFQHNPHGCTHADIGWGHASSTDLIGWTEHPVAIPADESEQVFSGSIVIDHENTAGFAGPGETALVAIYTSMSTTTAIQAQALAHSVDGGMTWTRYRGNPVLDRGSRDFRDPKVFRYGGPDGAYWVMVAVEAADCRVVLYRSDDLKQWTFLSSYGPAGAVGGVWECPDLFPLAVDGDPGDVRWVLVISLNPGGIAGGSGTQYMLGRFDGSVFTPDVRHDEIRSAGLGELDWIDYGRDCYAGVTFHGLPDDERTLIAWMGNWDYAQYLPEAPWRGAMTTARRLSLSTRAGRPRLVATPVLPAGTVLTREQDAAAWAVPAAARIDLTVRVGDEIGFSLRGADGTGVVLRCTPSAIVLDRTGAGDFHADFPSVERMELTESASVVRFTAVVDAGSIEVFADDGARTLTDLVPWEGELALRLHALKDAAVEAIEVRDLRP